MDLLCDYIINRTIFDKIGLEGVLFSLPSNRIPNVVSSNDSLNVSMLTPSSILFPSQWMLRKYPYIYKTGRDRYKYQGDIRGTLCSLHTPENGVATRASIDIDKIDMDIISNGTYNPVDDNNIRDMYASEPSVLQNKILSDILGYDPRRVYLNLTPPEGGDIILDQRYAAPDRNFEYSLDGFIWHTWKNDPDYIPTEAVPKRRKITLEAGQTLFVRNASATTVSLATFTHDYYNFLTPDNTALYGILESMVNKNPFNGSFQSAGIAGLFSRAHVVGHPVSISKSIVYGGLRMVFYTSGTLNRITISATTASSDALFQWLSGAPAGGVLTCPESLVLSSGTSGLPSSWTRENL